MSMRVLGPALATSVLALTFASSAQAAPATGALAPAKTLTVDAGSNAGVQPVHYRRHFWWGPRWHRHRHHHHHRYWRWRW